MDEPLQVEFEPPSSREPCNRDRQHDNPSMSDGDWLVLKRGEFLVGDFACIGILSARACQH